MKTTEFTIPPDDPAAPAAPDEQIYMNGAHRIFDKREELQGEPRVIDAKAPTQQKMFS